MRKYGLIILLSAFALWSYAADPIKVTSKIESVTVYRQGAEVVNSASVDIPTGTSEIVFEGLSNNVHESSLQVAGTEGITLLSAIYQLNYLKAQQKLPEVVKIEDSLKILGLELTRVTAKTSVFKEEENLLNVNQSIGGENVGVSVAELQKAMDFMRTRLQQIKTEIINLEQTQKKLNDRIAKLRSQLAGFNQQHNRPFGEVVLTISAKAATSVTLRISYLVHSAGWTPVYDLRAGKLDDPVTLTYKGNVQQNTGVNWEKVKLTLSTGNPTQSQTNPELTAWHLDFYNPIKKGLAGWAPATSTYKLEDVGEFKNKERDDYEQVNEDNFNTDAYLLDQYVSMLEKQINVEFEIDIPYTIPSDGKEQLVAMNDHELPAAYTYFAIPKLDKDAFLVADITGWETVHLLRGTANIFFEGNYVGQTTLNPDETGDTLRVSFGRDNKVVVKRELLKDFTSKKFIATNKKVTYGYEISVRNTKQQAIKVEVQDQLPVSGDSAIEVEAEEISGAVHDTEKGKLTWKYELNPAETKAVRLVYSVKYPKGKTVANL